MHEPRRRSFPSASFALALLAVLGRLRQVMTERPDIFDLYELMGEVEEAIRSSVEARIRLFGSEGKVA